MTDPFSPALMTIADFCRWSRLGRTKTYEEIGERRLLSVKIGRRTYIRAADAEAWLDGYVKAQSGPKSKSVASPRPTNIELR